MTEKIKEFVSSRNFLLIIIGLFTLQCIWFAGSINPEIPPDEQFHRDFIALYADEPILSGPILSHQPDDTLHLGDVQQTPSFLYHYVMSFPLRLIDMITPNMSLQYLFLRIINIAIGVASLIVLWLIFKKANFGDFITNLAIALFASTGMFLWISSAISYDGLSMLGWFAFLWSLLCMMERISWNNIAKVLLFAILITIIKVTYAPVLFGVICAYLVIDRKRLKTFVGKGLLHRSPKINEKHKKITTLILTVLLLVVSLVAMARLGTNLVRYHSITPSCQTVHSAAACSVSPMVQRNNAVAASVEQLRKAGKQIAFTPVYFTGQWADIMYQRLYFYFGKQSFGPSGGGELVFVLALVLLAYLLVTKRSKLVTTDKEFILFFSGALYIVVLFTFHFHHYLTTGNQYGFQGRYLLPAVPIAYVFFLKLIQMVNRNLTPGKQKILISACLVLLVAFIYEDFPFLNFIQSTDTSWYTPPTTSINQKLHNVASDIHQLVR